MAAAGQKKDSTWTGRLEGIVRDSIHDYELSAATVALYFEKDSNLITFRLTGEDGGFSLDKLPLGQPLYLMVSYLGYTTRYLPVLITKQRPLLQLKEVSLIQKNRELPTVEIGVPPVQFNGDTLEFNASAFKMDQTAQTEDLLKMLPGVIVWNDGSITVNGKIVSKVLVNGKPFFGGDTKIATQNIPKNAVDKIQVYKAASTPGSILDSLLEINVELQRGKDIGHFGKISIGAGTVKHYEADASMNFFTKRNQLSLVAAANDVNKIAKDLNTILRNTTFKGIGTSLEYQPQLTVHGINSPTNAGVSWQYDFLPDVGNVKINKLNLNYFLNDIHESVSRQSKTEMVLGNGLKNTQENQSAYKNHSSDHAFNSKYEKNNQLSSFSTSLSFNLGHLHAYGSENTNSFDNNNVMQSQNILQSLTDSKYQVLNLTIDAEGKKSISKSHLRPEDYQVKYLLTARNKEDSRVNESEFIALKDVTLSRYFDRKYEEKKRDVEQLLDVRLGNFLPWIVGPYSPVARFKLKVVNILELRQGRNDNKAFDRIKSSGDYVINPALTSEQRNLVVNEAPGISLSRNIIRSLDQRYQKNLLAELILIYQFYRQKNESTQESQRFDLSATKFAPKLTINYLNNQYGAFQDSYNWSVEVKPDYPTSNQMVPFVDSINQYFILLRNKTLKPADRYELSFNMQHNNVSGDKPFNYVVSFNIGAIDKPITEDVTTDSLGRQTFRYINLGTERHARISLTLNRAFKFNSNLLELQLYGASNYAERPNNLNGFSNLTRSMNNTMSLGFAYSINQLIALNLSQQFRNYQAVQKEIKAKNLNSYTYSTVLSASCNATSRFTINTNVSYNNNSGYNIDNFVIWNATAIYRLTRAKDCEIRLAALDLLRQNKGVFYEGNINALTTTTVNVLKQYFLLSFSYYPRKFGNKIK
ncbi:hypothetical protein J2T02_003965 [Chitinophaga terrae (ex Kim and Jung 2007)]|uniref:TonB-dependent receptor n=1 Tax=Chitinophaga terrae (ex Kim and Jung 2007) TaxID=408074 RepID=UPI00278893DE|nr:TonB-dependent receptor [Chitinophaga terrae (ex Kim and Jung 2007)]MDQ0108825.1 hypothetical protein [Chitinophaga terrae (ex Kim and Jung 2007)]